MSQESILVVDDEEVMRDVLGSLLTQAGYQVSLAPNGPEGLELARKGGYAAALVDMMLPEMDGMTVLEELKRIDPAIHAIMLTGYPTMETARESLNLGADEYCVKPIDKEELETKVASVLARK